MNQPRILVSPKQAARAMGVSESSLKRWCDQGLIDAVRTAGGHRKMHAADVLQFVRERGRLLVSPEVLGLPPASEYAALGLSRGRARLVDALLAGKELLARQIVIDLYFAKHSLCVIFDEVIAAAFHQIGDRWADHEAAVYQERRACEICLRVLFDVRKALRQRDDGWPAVGGTIEGDYYALPTAMAELVLRNAGYRATSLGTSIPFGSLIKAVQETRPKLFWLSVSHIREGLKFVAEFAALSRTCAASDTALVVGGRALTPELRQRMTYSAYGDTMQHLEGFANTLGRTLHRDARSSPTKRRKSK